MAVPWGGMTDELPSPPFPARDSPILAMIVQNAMTALESGEATVEQAIVHAAVHAWYEGHVQGEDACPGCDYRGNLPKQRSKRWINPDLN